MSAAAAKRRPFSHAVSLAPSRLFSATGRALMRRRVRRRLPQPLYVLAVQAPAWSRDDGLCALARSYGLTRRFEAIGRTPAEILPDMERLGSAQGFEVSGSGNAWTLTFADGARYSVEDRSAGASRPWGEPRPSPRLDRVRVALR